MGGERQIEIDRVWGQKEKVVTHLRRLMLEELRPRMCSSRSVRQVCEGGFRLRTRYLLTLVSRISIPSLSSSPRLRGATQPAFSRLIRRISARTSGYTAVCPGFPRQTYDIQNIRNALRCHVCGG